MSQQESIQIEELEENKLFRITRTITEEIDAKALLVIVNQIMEGKVSMEKQKEDGEKGLSTLMVRLEEFNKHEQKARLWAKEEELHNLRKSQSDNKPAEDQAQPNYVK